ncbi:MAG: hypothetical protein FWG66_03450 [Spirochaetes bacterium]|nr:hypothetical protein [Spirochaetota bacterium]
MIRRYPGERNRRKKLKTIEKFKRLKIELDIRSAKMYKILFVCSQCGLQISFEPRCEKYKTAYMSFDFDDYKKFFENDPDFIPLEYKNRSLQEKTYWSGATNYICLECGEGIGIFKGVLRENACDHSGNGAIVKGSDLGGKPCPVCETALDEGIPTQGFEAYWAKESELEYQRWEKYRERYNVKKPIPKSYTKEEIAEQERRNRKALEKCYIEDEYYVLNSPNNALRYVFNVESLDSTGTFYCILEWDDNFEGKLTLFKYFGGVWVEKNIDREQIQAVINLLKKYDYFNKALFKNYQGLDGYTICLEVKYGQEYKELCIWGIRSGILYEMGMLLIQFAGKTFKELYEYAW